MSPSVQPGNLDGQLQEEGQYGCADIENSVLTTVTFDTDRRDEIWTLSDTRILEEVGDALGRLATIDPVNTHFEVARKAIRDEEDRAPDDDEVQDLAKELAASLRAFCRRFTRVFGELSQDEHLPGVESQQLHWEQGGLFRLDAESADFLERLGPEGKEMAAKIRAKSRQRWGTYVAIQPGAMDTDAAQQLWRLWWDPQYSLTSMRFIPALAHVLWKDIVHVQRERIRKKSPAIALPIAADLIRTMRPGGQLSEDGGLMTKEGTFVATVEREIPLQVPTVELTTAERLLPTGVTLLSRLNAHRLLRWEILEAHKRVLNAEPDARALRLDGGWRELARRIEAGSGRKASEEIHAIVIAQAHLCLTWPDGTRGNLLSYTLRPATGGRPAHLTLVLGDVLLPDFVLSLVGRGRKTRESRRLVPIVPLPSLIGRPNEHGAQASFQLLLLAELRRRARELVQEGGVHLSEADKERLGEEAGLPAHLLPRVLESWVRDGDDNPAFLEQVARDRYNLSLTHNDAKEFLEEAGRKELSGSMWGQQSQKRKKRLMKRR